MIGHRGIFLFRARFAFFHTHASLLTPSSVSLSYFILSVPMRKCLGKHLCMSSPFPIAILNGTFFFRSVKAMNNWKRSAIKQILLLLLLKYLGSQVAADGGYERSVVHTMNEEYRS